jgi:hypothetical protein
MDENEQDHKKLLEEQLEWSKRQGCILEEMNEKLHNMKSIAEYVLKHNLTSVETEKLNGQFNELKREVYTLEKQLRSDVH